MKVRIFIKFLVLLISCVVATNNNAHGKGPKKLKSVFIHVAKKSEIFDTSIYPGKVLALVKSTVLSEAEGIVSKFNFRLGQKLKKGAIIAKVRRTDPNYQFKAFNVRAPIDGVVSEVHSYEGSVVSLKSKLLTIINPKYKRVVIHVTLGDLKNLKLNAKANFEYSGESKTVIVKGIAPVVDSITATAGVELDFLDLENSFPIGTLGKVSFKLNHHMGLLLPRAAITYKTEKAYVGVVNKLDHTVKKVMIKKVRRQGGMVEITKGIKELDFVVVRASGFVKDGAKVEIKNLPKKEVKDFDKL